jgi:hypothetical protein
LAEHRIVGISAGLDGGRAGDGGAAKSAADAWTRGVRRPRVDGG